MKSSPHTAPNLAAAALTVVAGQFIFMIKTGEDSNLNMQHAYRPYGIAVLAIGVTFFLKTAYTAMGD